MTSQSHASTRSKSATRSQDSTQLSWAVPLRKLLSKAAERALHSLPEGIRYSLIRRNIHIPRLEPGDQLVFKLAETFEELGAALKLLHDSYVRAGLMDRHPAGIRTNIYQTLPFSTVLIAKVGKNVVGTVGLIQDSPIGFPSDQAFSGENDRLRKSGRVCEVSALAIDPRFRNRGHQVSLYLMKFLYHYTLKYMGVDILCASVHPRAADFYMALMGFSKLGDVDNYGYVKGKPGTHLMLDLRVCDDWWIEAYKRAPVDRHLYQFFKEGNEPQLCFPTRDHVALMDPVMTPELLETFYIQRTDVLLKATPYQLELVYSAYSPFFDLRSLKIFQKIEAVQRPFRNPVSIPCFLSTLDGKLSALAKIADLSAAGAFIQTEFPLIIGNTYVLRFKLGRESVVAPLVPRWANDGIRLQVGSGFGCQFLNPVEAVNRSIEKAYQAAAERSPKSLKKARAGRQAA